jgi:alanine racemase
MRPTYALINLSNLKQNYLNIRKKVTRQRRIKVMAVVKADSYGHGVKETVKALNSLGKQKPEYFAVAFVEEAVELRNCGVKQPILIFEPVNNVGAELVIKNDLIPTVFTTNHLSILKSAKHSSGKIKVHVKVDTGMNRLGINFKETLDFISRLSLSKSFEIDGIYTHFATSDENNKSFAKVQLKRFNKLIAELKNKKIKYGLAHAANSGAILDMPETYFDMVRPGVSLYGYYPSQETTESIKLKPVMSIISKVASVKVIEKGDTVSYGRIFKAKRATKIISVPIGYADGYNRLLSNKAEAIIKNKKYPQIGRVTMDRIMFNVFDDNVKVGDKVILLGESGKLKINAWDWSKIINTIPYEVTCSISKRVPRIYIS